MATISAEAVKTLREKTGVSFIECKKALEASEGDVEGAITFLSRRSADVARKKADRTLDAGIVASYVHSNGQVGALVLLACETDFVSKNEEFGKLAYDIAMHVAATRPQFVRREDLSPTHVEELNTLFAPDVEGKPENLKAQILEGKVNARLQEIVLTEQAYIKDDSKTINELLSAATQKFGERVEISRAVYFAVK